MCDTRPITFDVDPAQRVRRATFRGVITEPVLLSTYGRLISEPGYDFTLNDLIDMRTVSRLEVGPDAIRQLVDLFAHPGEGATNRCAIVTATDHVFGMARMYEMLSWNSSELIHVFRDIEEAERWLRAADHPPR
ncbi:Marine sediment metagenome DNA, contig: S01H1_S25812 OS=marine sediment metagenome GN=S01H1_61839 PE=4 SV=1: SpoIIAA-like [Gemmata massiliana]|uniref:STAS/SEC14 domain-containing protein n=1 Tax=Gemmata massiliana TaxID=1210884 RepID=A0A6P2DCP3_9BACT|nr:hypothetical protein [Gemmata massiliana]VTR98548.1 Marine sediment metagenome DNA, contig: S01H1_S25812 OS=marine sediment metagenome GN=S01H1_61839 PE=4 SV=1: SpoIIAA-like [Gemmata massiliana]